MSETLCHECGIALIRLKQPLDYFFQKYGSPLFGLSKLFLLMEKQHNRGQDGCGVAAIKLDMPAGEPFMFRKRELGKNPIVGLFQELFDRYDKCVAGRVPSSDSVASVKRQFPFAAEVYLGHLRYGTSGGYGLSSLHPYFRKSSWRAKNLMLAGNFNMANTAELNALLIEKGQHPVFGTDTQALLETAGFELDQEHERLLVCLRKQGFSGESLACELEKQLDLFGVVQRAVTACDGGYALIGALGSGDAFAVRDPLGIRPVYWFEDDELVAVASERPPLVTVFERNLEDIRELEPGHMLLVSKTGEAHLKKFAEAPRRSSCSFERIYLSRGNDPDIYRERKALGANLCDQVLDTIQHDLSRTVFSYIPNTAEPAYLGLLDEIERRRRITLAEAILSAQRAGRLDRPLLDGLLAGERPRAEKILHKDVKLRTFIAQQASRRELGSHIYDVTYGIIGPEDNLVCIDDSVVRGTTLKRSIVRILSRLNPRRIVIASTAPQIRYPDCYGIDMSDLGDLVAFQATISLLVDSGHSELIEEVYQRCVRQMKSRSKEPVNEVQVLYSHFSPEEISRRIAQLVRPTDLAWQGELLLVFPSIESLHRAVPQHSGDWYFSGRFPSPGGNRVVNQAFINYCESQRGRSY